MFYIEKGSVKLIAATKEGKEAILGILDGGDFFGESSIGSDRPFRLHSAIALTDAHLVRIDRHPIKSALSAAGDGLYAFVSCLLARNTRLQQELITFILESGEKRLARALWVIFQLKRDQRPPFPQITQQDLANMVGITRQRVNILLKRFRKSGFIDEAAGLKVNPSILAILREDGGTEA